MIRYLIPLVTLAITLPAAAQVHTFPVELVDSTPATPGIVISKAVLVPPVAKGVAVKPCGKVGDLWVVPRGRGGTHRRAGGDRWHSDRV